MTEILNQEEEIQDQGELYEHHHFVVDNGQAPVRIDKFIVNRLQGISRNKIQCATDAGNILANGKPVKSSYKVRPGDEISIVMAYPPKEFELIPEDIPINIIYEDDDLLVVNKDAGMVVHPGFGNFTGTLLNALAWHLKDLPLFQNGDARPGLVHRIDKDTSGILVVAKTELAANKLARQFFDHSIDRKYQALVWGDFKEDEGTIEGNIGRSPRDRTKMCVFDDASEGKTAITHYKVLERFGYVTLIECILETGRTHQIRVHLKHKGHPLFNDETYGGNIILKGTTFTKYKQFIQNCFKILPRQALHAKSLGFIHPATGKYMLFDSELPADLKEVLEKWRNYTSNRNNIDF